MSQAQPVPAPTDNFAEFPVDEWGEPDLEQYNAFVKDATLAQIEVARIVAERRAAGASTETNFTTRAGFIIDSGAIHWRFDCTANVIDADGTTLGVIEATVIVTIEHPQEPPPPEVLARFGNTTATLMSHPYLRETIATAAQRIGLPNILLPMMRL